MRLLQKEMGSQIKKIFIIYQYNQHFMKGRQKQDDFELSLQLKTIMNQLKCSSSHQIKRICDNNNCQLPALFCMEKQCQTCNQAHQNCRSYSFEMFTKLVQKRSSGPIWEFLEKITQIENSMIEAMQKQRRRLTHTFMIDQLASSMDKKYYKMIEQIYRHKDTKSIVGKDASQLFEKLQQTQIESQSREEELLETFNQQTERILKEYLQVKDWIYDSALGNDKYKKKQKQKKEDILPIQSKILKIKNEQLTLANLIKSTNKKVSMFSKIIQQQLALQDKIFIKDMFGVPNIKFQMVFRASDNDFSASRFHQICDHIQNTFIVIHNQFGKTFAGFTSLTWFGDNIFKHDDENSSFLISFDQRLKMILFNRNKAIYCSQSYGPTYGGDSNYLKLFNSYDLLIGDKCNTTASSYYDYPKSYQFHQRSTDSFNIFGVEKGKKFKIRQYEVFKVSTMTQ